MTLTLLPRPRATVPLGLAERSPQGVPGFALVRESREERIGVVSGESALVAGLHQGSDAAYETLVRTYGPQMLAIARRYFPAQEDAEDVLQSAFLLVFRFIHGFQGKCKLSTWLHRVVVNCSLMRIRTRHRHPEERLSVSACEDHQMTEFGSGAGPSVDEELAQQETRARLLRAVEYLPDMVRGAVRLRDLEGLSLDQTSLLLGRSLTSVKMAIRRGHLTLRAMLDHAPRHRKSGAVHSRPTDASPARVSVVGGHRTVLRAATPTRARSQRTAAGSKVTAACAWSAARLAIEPTGQGAP